jgi:2-polyprenyl-3-methyl-5-hydroxy-6-metoxy-1,4-benzoquinol methylase
MPRGRYRYGPPALRLPPHIYDREYFLSNTCEGADEFHAGRGLSALKARQVELLAPGPGLRVLDLGCGRGEVLLACARRGAAVAGVDYSHAAVEISRETLAEVAQAEVVQGDVAQLPWPDASFDRVLSGDVIEHLHPADGAAMLREARRVLRPGGRVVVHTSPNRLFLDVAWPLARWPLLAAGYGESVHRLEAWVAASKRYHVNEQTLHGLRRSVRAAGFSDPTVWIDPNIVRDGSHHTTAGLEHSWMIRAGQRLAALRAVRLFCGNDLWAVATR